MKYTALGQAKSANEAWLDLLEEVYDNGRQVQPRGKKTRELIGCQTAVDMTRPLLTIKERKLGYKFTVAEAAWILGGDNRVETIMEYSRHISSFSDDGVFFFGAYGPKIKDQITHVVESLYADPDTRQAVINIWRENPRPTKDVPCTISVQFFLRDNTLHCQDTMRSSDCWLGWPYDVFNFSMLSIYVAILLRNKRIVKGLMADHDAAPKIGELRLTAGSQHIYEPQWNAVEDIVFNRRECLSGAGEYAPLDINEFDRGQDLIDYLWKLARYKQETMIGVDDKRRTFLQELWQR